jgi:methyl-accepting chemotaxis protein
MKRYFTAILVLTVILSVAFFALAGCGGQTPEQAREQLNTDLANLKSSLTVFTNPATYTSTDSIQKAVDNVQTDLDAVLNSAKDVKDVSTSALSSSWNDLKKSVDDTLNSNESVSQKIESIQSSLEDFVNAWQQLEDELSTTSSAPSK